MDVGGIVHNGLTLDDSPFERRRGDALCFVGRVAPEKGIVEAIEIAQATGRAAADRRQGRPDGRPSGTTSTTSSRPRSKAAGSLVEFLGELEQADRDRLFAE